MFADITAASTHSTGPGDLHDVIRKHVFTCSLHLQRYKGCAHVPLSVRRVPLLQPVGASAAFVQVSSINKGTYTHNCQSTMFLLVIDFSYLEGKNGELVVKELATLDCHSNRVSSYVFKYPTVRKICHCLTLD
jgi:hypothetical protein